MSAKSKKGGRWEREVCKTLSLWFSGGDPDRDLFWRTAGSGGRATNRKKRGRSAERHQGDVCAIDPQGEDLLKVFSLELKNGYNKFTIQDVLDRPGETAQEYEKWFAQAEESRQGSGALFWLIVCKRDKRKPLVITDERFEAELTLTAGHSWRGPGIKLRLDVGSVVVLMATLEDFLLHVKPEAVRALARGR